MKKSTLFKYLEYVSLCELRAKDYKVFLNILSELVNFEEITLNQNRVAEELGITKSDVSKALRRLEKNKIICFKWISERRKYLSLVEYDDDGLDEIIEEKIEERVSSEEDWEL